MSKNKKSVSVKKFIGSFSPHALLILSLIYFISRIYQLSILPIFNDESIYINYGLLQLFDSSHKPFSLLIGKEPLLPFLYGVFGNLGNLLIGARLVTVFFGFLTFLGLYLFAKSSLNSKAAFFAALFYILAPFNLFYDRLAILDSPINTIAIWSLLLTQSIFKKPEFKKGIALGLIMGVGLWIKSSAIFYLLLPALGYVFFTFTKKNTHKFLIFKILFVTFVTAGLIFLPLSNEPFYAESRRLNKEYTYPLSYIFSFPIKLWFSNFFTVITWLFFYLTPPLFILAIGSMFIYWKRYWLVSFWFIIPFTLEIFYARIFYARYSLLLSIPLLFFAGYGAYKLFQKKIKALYAFCLLIFIWCTFYNYLIYHNPVDLPKYLVSKARADTMQYVHGFPSGYGVLEAMDYLKQESEKQPIIVITRGDHGNPEDAVGAYLGYLPNVEVVIMGSSPDEIGNLILEYGRQYPIYFVSRGSNYAGLEKYFANEKKFTKPNDTEFVGVQKLNIK